MVCIRSAFRVKEVRTVRMNYRVCSASDVYERYIAVVLTLYVAGCSQALAVQCLKFIFKLK